jgi:hypothetical protein
VAGTLKARKDFESADHPSARVDADLMSTTGVPWNASIGPIFHAFAVNLTHRHALTPFRFPQILDVERAFDSQAGAAPPPAAPAKS